MMMSQSPQPPLKTPAGMLQLHALLKIISLCESHAVISLFGTALENHTLVGEIHCMLVLVMQLADACKLTYNCIS